MALSLSYQSVYIQPRVQVVSVKWHLLSGLLLAAALVFRIWVKLESTSLGYEVGKERQHTVNLDMQRRELELQLSVLLKPDNLSKRATRLGFVPLSSVDSLTLPEARR